MILESLVALSLVVKASVESGIPPAPRDMPSKLTAQQKSVVMQPLVRAATDCILHAVTADPRVGPSVRSGDVRELIVASMPTCADSMRAMIAAHDRLYGEGSGETFFMGPYLDMLPAAVINTVKATPK